MAGDIYPRFRATAVQAAPVFLDREATISKSPDFKRRGLGRPSRHPGHIRMARVRYRWRIDGSADVTGRDRAPVWP
jgi:hypothetical protein